MNLPWPLSSELSSLQYIKISLYIYHCLGIIVGLSFGKAFATRLVQAGVDLITVQRLLGHAKIAIDCTLRALTYEGESSGSRAARCTLLQPDPNRTREVVRNEGGEEPKPQYLKTLGS